LRSHGGLHEQSVPLVSSHDLSGWPAKLRNFDAFDIVLNRMEGA
jgi:hypothetical protein